MDSIAISNMALYRAGSSIRITSLDESTERTEAVRQCAFWYPIIRDQVIQAAPWNCARKAVALATITDTTYPGYNYLYEYPSDCLHAVAVCDVSGIRNSNYWLSFYPDHISSFVVPRVPFEVIARDSEDSRAIATDITQAYLLYIFNQTNTAVYTPLLCNAIAWKMGAELGGALNIKTDRKQYCQQMYFGAMSEAQAMMLNEARQDPEQDSPSIQVRGW